MKLTFSNLGAIKQTELDLRPLTIIIGPNNSNKTYIAYSVYGLWQNASRSWSHSYSNLRFKIENETTLSLQVDKTFTDSFIKDSEEAAKIFQTRLENFFQDSSHKLFSKTTFKIHVTPDDIKTALNNFVNHGLIKISSRISATVSLEDSVLYLKIEGFKFKSKSFKGELFDFVYPVILGLKSQLFHHPFLLPAERNAFIITYKMLANRRYKFLRQTQRELFTRTKVTDQRQLELLREQGDIRYPEPIEDFLDFLTDIELQSNTDSPTKKTEFRKLADNIERYIQNNHKTDLKPTKFGGKEIKINIRRGLSIDLYNASSSIKQLAPLLLYLRYQASQNDLLIIDEPEMNLHPESQAKLLEVLGILVSLGVKVLLTTHSPYFMSHLNNLISGDKSNPEDLETQAESLYLNDARAFIHSNNVSAYEMKNNKLVSLKSKDYGIKWDTLSDVSADLQQKFFEIYEKGETPPRGQDK